MWVVSATPWRVSRPYASSQISSCVALGRVTATLGLGGGPVRLLYPVSPSGHVPAMVPEGAPSLGRGPRGETRTDASSHLLMSLVGVMP